MKNIILPLLFTLLFSCSEKSQHEHGAHHHQGHDHNHSNELMNKRSFEDLVANFEGEDRAAWQKPDEVIALLGDLRDKTVLDIGAGTGYFSFRLADKGAQVIAADVDERFQQYIRDKKVKRNDSLVTTRLTRYDDPLLSPAEVDHAIIINTYHHIENREDYFGKVLAGLKPEGILLVVDYKKAETPHGPPMDHRMDHSIVVKELESAGFTDLQVEEDLLENQYVVKAYKKQEAE
jgi:cyclopropane fatty-acyl-phospholipid synthase-like methyltransferase